jgi:hypothetical protein
MFQVQLSFVVNLSNVFLVQLPIFFLKLLVTISVAPVITGIIVHFRFHIRCISIHKLLYFNFLFDLLLLLLLIAVELSLGGSSPYTSTDKTNTYPPMTMEQIKCSETSAYKIQTPGNHSKERVQHSEHGENLKSRNKNKYT